MLRYSYPLLREQSSENLMLMGKIEDTLVDAEIYTRRSEMLTSVRVTCGVSRASHDSTPSKYQKFDSRVIHRIGWSSIGVAQCRDGGLHGVAKGDDLDHQRHAKICHVHRTAISPRLQPRADLYTQNQIMNDSLLVNSVYIRRQYLIEAPRQISMAKDLPDASSDPNLLSKIPITGNASTSHHSHEDGLSTRNDDASVHFISTLRTKRLCHLSR
jgi:hypothetical protein